MARSSSTSSSETGRSGTFELLLLAGLVLGFVLTPLASTSGRRAVRQPYEFKRHTTLEIHARDLPEQSVVTINGQGLRGDLLATDSFNVVLAGGSTAICELLDEESMLTAQMRAAISVDLIPATVRVAAEARGGQRTSGAVRYFSSVEALGRPIPDLIVALNGANEVDLYFRGSPWVEDAPHGRSDDESPFGPLRSAETYAGWYSDDGEFLDVVRRAYAAHEKAERLSAQQEEDLERHLGVYREQLSELEQVAGRLGADLILATQPLNYSSSDREGSLAAWAPFLRQFPPRPPQILSIPYRQARPHAQGYVPAPELYDAVLARFNTVLREFADEREIRVVDLAAQMNECVECYYDHWHFNRTGARIAAGLLAAGIDAEVSR